MTDNKRRRLAGIGLVVAMLLGSISSARADEVWVAPTYQTDLGGLGVGSSVIWPATVVGAVRLVWSIPDNLQTFQSAKVVLIPGSPAGAANVNLFVCAAQNSDVVTGSCAGPFVQAFSGVANHLSEVDISSAVAAHVGTAGSNHLAVVAYTTPTTVTDHIVGLRFTYAPKVPAGVATLAANTFTGTQTATAFVGSGAGLTNLPIPAGAATLGANTFSGTQTAPAFVGSGVALTGVAKLTANTFTATQTISSGNLDLDSSSATSGNITKGGTLFLHNAGSDNVFLGDQSGNLTTIGSLNVAVGSQTLMAIDGGGSNTALGTFALRQNTSGSANTAIGHSAMLKNSSGVLNTAVGSQALQFDTGNNNTAVGESALQLNTSGSSNTAIGIRALSTGGTGNNNVAVGAEAGLSSNGSGNIYLGANVNGVQGENNTMYLGRVGTQTKTLIAGVRGITTGAANAIPVLIDANGQLGTVSSSVRFKQDIHDMADASRRLFDLRPVTFRYIQAYSDGSTPVQFGLVAEEVARAFPELAVRDANGNVETVHYETLNVLLLNEVQRQKRELDELKEKVSELMGRSRAE